MLTDTRVRSSLIQSHHSNLLDKQWVQRAVEQDVRTVRRTANVKAVVVVRKVTVASMLINLQTAGVVLENVILIMEAVEPLFLEASAGEASEAVVVEVDAEMVEEVDVEMVVEVDAEMVDFELISSDR